METWRQRLRLGRVLRDWSQEDLAIACAEHNSDTVQTWRQMITHIELGRVVPAPEQAAILERVLGLPSAEDALATP